MYYLKRDGEKPETRQAGIKIPASIQVATGLNLLQATARMGFVYIMLTGGIGEFLEVPISAMTLNVIGAVFFLLGIAGAASVWGMLARKAWALKTLLAVNVLTILFDVWGYTVQSSAFLGFIVPLLTIVLLLRGKSSWGMFN